MALNNLWVGKGFLKSKKTITINDSLKGSYEVTDLVLSIRRIIKGTPKITLIPLEAWGEMSELSDDFNEGDMVIVEGHFENKKWRNQSKAWMTKNVVVVEKITKG